MTNRERILGILEDKPVDRMSAVHFGYWSELLLEWAEQGHITKSMATGCIDGLFVDRKIDKLLGWDCCYSPRGSAYNYLLPLFKSKVVGTTEKGDLVRNGLGVIELHVKDCHGIPAEIDYLLKDRESWEKYYKSKMSYHRIRNVGSVAISCFQKLSSQFAGVFWYGSVIGTIRNITTLLGLSYMMYDDFELLKEVVDTWNDMQYTCLEKALKYGFKYDIIHIWEDMCFNNGPLISPDMYRELCGKHFKRISDLAKKHGIKHISVDCDGDIRAFAPIYEEFGIDVMFPIEYGTWKLDILKIREVAPTLKGIGGMNKHVLSLDKEAVDKEIERLKPLVQAGRFIPCPDHRLPPGTKWELVQYYTSKIKKIMD